MSGLDFTVGLESTLSIITGGHYDILGLSLANARVVYLLGNIQRDPRGVGTSEPHITCLKGTFLNDLNTRIGAVVAKVGGGVETTGKFTNSVVLDHFYATEAYYDFIYSTYGSTSYSAHGDTLKYIRTAAAVRDMIALAGSLEIPAKLINYWGFSYGTGRRVV